jgi:predicted phosphodiesterase
MNTSRARLRLFCLALLVLCAAAGCASTDGDKWTFVVAGDSRGRDNGINAKVVDRLVPAIAREKPDLVLVPGDLVQGYAPPDAVRAQLLHWRKRFMEPLLDAGIRVYPIRGNHDLARGGQQPWNEVFAGKYALPQNGPADEKGFTYAVRHKNALFLNLESYVLKGRVDQAWVDAQLAGHDATHVFAQAHEPIYSMEDGHRDTLESNRPARDALIVSLVTGGGTAFFCGHDHWYDHGVKTVAGLPLHQFIVGTAGAPLRSSKGKYRDKDVKALAHARAYGYLVVSVDGDRLTARMKALLDDGSFRVIEEFTWQAGLRSAK